jgi:hypothetical protein
VPGAAGAARADPAADQVCGAQLPGGGQGH